MGWKAGLVVAAAWCSACLESNLVRCGELVCPSGLSCVAGELCASQEQLDACADLADGDICTLAGAVGRCDRGVCVAAGCGNNVVDPGEVCDDGNLDSGDGCRADCRKVELCGDGLLDQNEGCDDGNANPADGCDACNPTAWRARVVVGANVTATSVGVLNPTGVAFDLQGNFYIAESATHRIRRVDTNGVITTVAGIGVFGFGGDGGPATNATLASPANVAVDGLGNIYITDTNNQRIRRIDPEGRIATVAGSGSIGSTGDNGPGVAATLSAPQGVAVDGLGNIYIADTNNHRIRRVDAFTGVITAFAGNGTPGLTGDDGPALAAQLAFPLGLAFDNNGDLLVADANNSRIRRIDATSTITTLAGTVFGFAGDNGPATSARLANPSSIAVDSAGTIYIADRFNNRIRTVTGTTIQTIVNATGTAGATGDGGDPLLARLSTPTGVAVDGNNRILIADRFNHRIRSVSAGVITTAAGTGLALGANGEGGAATSASVGFVQALDTDGADLYFADTSAHRIRKVDAAGMVTTIAGTGQSGFSGDGVALEATLASPSGLTIRGQQVFVADSGNHRIRVVDLTTGMISTIAGTGTGGGTGDDGPAIDAQLNNPGGLAFDAAGDLFVADRLNHKIRKISQGTITRVAGTGVIGGLGDTGQALLAQLSFPSSVAFDGDGNLLIADSANNRIRQVDGSGTITTFAGSGSTLGDGGPPASAQLFFPSGVAVSGTRVFIAEGNGQRVRIVDGGVINTYAGTGGFGGNGDGGPASSATLTASSVAVDASGNVYAGASGRIRRVRPDGTITTAAGSVDPDGMGPFPFARVADGRSLIRIGNATLIAGGFTGTVQLADESNQVLRTVAGRYQQLVETGNLARFRTSGFGVVVGIAHDPSTNLLFVAEATSHRLHAITMVDPSDAETWTIATISNDSGAAGFADGALSTAQFRSPLGMMFDPIGRQLYIADAGNHVLRAIDFSAGVSAATTRTIGGTPLARGFAGDGGLATAARLNFPAAVALCPNGDLFVADASNNRIRRISQGTITTVLGDGADASSGEGSPATSFPIHGPAAVVCDAAGNVFASSTTAVRMLPADDDGVVDGTGTVLTIYGKPPRDAFPENVTSCLTGLVVVGDRLQVVDSCAGILVELERVAAG